MGQRHQLYFIGRNPLTGEAMVFAGFHNQWCYGQIALRIAGVILDGLVNKFNAQTIKSELVLIALSSPNVEPSPSAESLEGSEALEPTEELDFNLSPEADNPAYPVACLGSGLPAPFLAALGYQLARVDFKHIIVSDCSFLDTETNPSNEDNNDGISVFDVSDPSAPRFCFSSVAGLEIPESEIQPALGVPLSAREYATLYYRHPGDHEATDESDYHAKQRPLGMERLRHMPSVSLIESSLLAETWGDPFTNRASKLDSPLERAGAVAVPNLSLASTSPSIISNTHLETLLTSDDPTLQAHLNTLKVCRPVQGSLDSLLEQALKLRFANVGDDGLSIADFSGGIVTGKELEVLVQLLGPVAMRSVVYLDISNTRPKDGALLSSKELHSIAAHLPNLGCINLIGSNCITPRTVNEFYSTSATRGSDPSAISSIALIYKFHTGADIDTVFDSLLPSALPLVSESPRFSIVIWADPGRFAHWGPTPPVALGASWPFFQLDSALEAIRSVIVGGMGYSNVEKSRTVVQAAMSSLGPGLGSVFGGPRPDLGIGQYSGSSEPLYPPDALKGTIRIFPPAVITKENIADVLDGGWVVLFDFISYGRSKSSEEDGGKRVPVGIFAVNAGKDASADPVASSTTSKDGPHTTSSFQSHTLESFIDVMLPHARDAHRPSSILLDRVKLAFTETSPLDDEELRGILKEMRPPTTNDL